MKEIPAQSRNPAGVKRDAPYLVPCPAWGPYRGAPGDPEAGVLLQNWGFNLPCANLWSLIHRSCFKPHAL